jgi:hypothetical protein
MSPRRLCDVVACSHRRLDAVRDADPLEDRGEVGLDGLLADPQAAGNEFVGEPAGDQVQYLALAIAQLRARSAAPGEPISVPAALGASGDSPWAGRGCADQLVGLGIFEGIPDAGLERGWDGAVEPRL